MKEKHKTNREDKRQNNNVKYVNKIKHKIE